MKNSHLETDQERRTSLHTPLGYGQTVNRDTPRNRGVWRPRWLLLYLGLLLQKRSIPACR